MARPARSYPGVIITARVELSLEGKKKMSPESIMERIIIAATSVSTAVTCDL